MSTMRKDSGAGRNALKLELDDENLTHKTVSVDVKKAILQGRLAKKLTQAQLAQQINEKPQIVQEYESGKAIPNQQILGKLERVLGVKLRGKGVGKKSARAREGKRNETRARRREAKRAGESRDAIDDEVSSRCIASRIARSLHTFCKSSCIDRSIRRRSRASRASLARPNSSQRRARGASPSGERGGCARELPRTSSNARFTPRSTRGGKDARRVSANAWRARRGERRFQNCL